MTHTDRLAVDRRAWIAHSVSHPRLAQRRSQITFVCESQTAVGLPTVAAPFILSIDPVMSVVIGPHLRTAMTASELRRHAEGIAMGHSSARGAAVGRASADEVD